MSENLKKFGLSVLACAIAVGAVLPMYEKWVKPLLKKEANAETPAEPSAE